MLAGCEDKKYNDFDTVLLRMRNKIDYSVVKTKTSSFSFFMK